MDDSKKDDRKWRCAECSTPLVKTQWLNGHTEEWEDSDSEWRGDCEHITGEFEFS